MAYTAIRILIVSFVWAFGILVNLNNFPIKRIRSIRMKKADNLIVGLLDGELLDAVIANDLATVDKLLAQKANPNCYEDKCQIRPLHFACVYNAVDVVFPLIKAGAKIDTITSDGYKPMDIAKQLNHLDIVEILTMLSTNLVSFY